MNIGREEPAIVVEPLEEPVIQPCEEPVPERDKEPSTSG